ncbi:hypothetical protein A8M77_31580 [Variovorax sp. JS1663]|nr:hypothetical protein A8M77_31580 [Variovorax sp. JS1663]
MQRRTGATLEVAQSAYAHAGALRQGLLIDVAMYPQSPQLLAHGGFHLIRGGIDAFHDCISSKGLFLPIMTPFRP